MKIIGIGGIVGLVVGVGVAEWLGNENNAAYYSVVVFVALVGSVIARMISGKSNQSDE